MTGIAVGDKGQCFEVTYKQEDGIAHVLGWADTYEAARKMADSWKLRPSTMSTFVRDREANAVDHPGDEVFR